MTENQNLLPLFKLVKTFPGMDQPIGTIFYKHEGWTCLGTENRFNTEWTMKYFKSGIGEFFEKV